MHAFFVGDKTIEQKLVKPAGALVRPTPTRTGLAEKTYFFFGPLSFPGLLETASIEAATPLVTSLVIFLGLVLGNAAEATALMTTLSLTTFPF